VNNPNPIREIRTRRGAGALEMRELDRDARMPKLLDLPAGVSEAGECMRAQHIVVVGLGSIGSYFAELLARMGVASLLLIDRDVSKSESVLTHPLHPRDIGRPKATLGGERAKAICPATRVRVFDGAVEDLPLDAFVGATAVLLASDNLECERAVSRVSTHLGLPLIQASVHGPTLVAEVRSLANRVGEDGPCLTCGYQAADWEALNTGTVYSCTGGPAKRNGIPTVSPPSLCSTAASLAITELLARCTELVSASESRVVTYCGFNHKTTVTSLDRRAECPSDHSVWRVAEWAGPLANATPRQLLSAAGCDGGDSLVAASMTVAGYRFCRVGICGCVAHPALGRFVPALSESSLCAKCEARLEPHPLYTYEVVPGKALCSSLDQTLAELGVAEPSTVLVRVAEEASLFHSPRASARSRKLVPSNQAAQVTQEVSP